MYKEKHLKQAYKHLFLFRKLESNFCCYLTKFLLKSTIRYYGINFNFIFLIPQHRDSCWYQRCSLQYSSTNWRSYRMDFLAWPIQNHQNWFWPSKVYGSTLSHWRSNYSKKSVEHDNSQRRIWNSFTGKEVYIRQCFALASVLFISRREAFSNFSCIFLYPNNFFQFEF